MCPIGGFRTVYIEQLSLVLPAFQQLASAVPTAGEWKRQDKGTLFHEGASDPADVYQKRTRKATFLGSKGA
eukprot:scaffold9606_cov99-Cylindrotheca_fusiformis.AAC.2